MLETIAVVVLVIITWINWSRFYVLKKIRKSLTQVKVGHPVRVYVNFSHYIKYFGIENNNEDEAIIFEYDGKKINITPDGKETILYINEEKEE
jgi:hypothetical protein